MADYWTIWTNLHSKTLLRASEDKEFSQYLIEFLEMSSYVGIDSGKIPILSVYKHEKIPPLENIKHRKINGTNIKSSEIIPWGEVDDAIESIVKEEYKSQVTKEFEVMFPHKDNLIGVSPIDAFQTFTEYNLFKMKDKYVEGI